MNKRVAYFTLWTAVNVCILIIAKAYFDTFVAWLCGWVAGLLFMALYPDR